MNNQNNNIAGENNGNNDMWQPVPDHWVGWNKARRTVPITKFAYQIHPGIDRQCVICGKDVSRDFAKVGAMACKHVHCYACMQKIVDSKLRNVCAVFRHPFRTWQAEAVEIESLGEMIQ